MRTPPNILRRSNLGIPATVIGRLGELPPAALHDCFGVVLQRLLWGDLSRFGLPPAPYGIATEIRMKGLGPLVDNGFVGLLKAGRLSLVAALEGFDGADVLLRDGSRLCPDVVIAATGYGFGLAPLVGELGVLLPSGRPALVAEHTHARAPGLYFNGYHAPLRGQLPAMKRTSHRIARAIARQWRAERPARATSRLQVDAAPHVGDRALVRERKLVQAGRRAAPGDRPDAHVQLGVDQVDHGAEHVLGVEVDRHPLPQQMHELPPVASVCMPASSPTTMLCPSSPATSSSTCLELPLARTTPSLSRATSPASSERLPETPSTTSARLSASARAGVSNASSRAFARRIGHVSKTMTRAPRSERKRAAGAPTPPYPSTQTRTSESFRWKWCRRECSSVYASERPT